MLHREKINDNDKSIQKRERKEKEWRMERRSYQQNVNFKMANSKSHEIAHATLS